MFRRRSSGPKAFLIALGLTPRPLLESEGELESRRIGDIDTSVFGVKECSSLIGDTEPATLSSVAPERNGGVADISGVVEDVVLTECTCVPLVPLTLTEPPGGCDCHPDVLGRGNCGALSDTVDLGDVRVGSGGRS